jgi:hypothetical protein
MRLAGCIRCTPRVYLVWGATSGLVCSLPTPHIGCDCQLCTGRFLIFESSGDFFWAPRRGIDPLASTVTVLRSTTELTERVLEPPARVERATSRFVAECSDPDELRRREIWNTNADSNCGELSLLDLQTSAFDHLAIRA